MTLQLGPDPAFAAFGAGAPKDFRVTLQLGPGSASHRSGGEV